jgi:hypothetical protein
VSRHLPRNWESNRYHGTSTPNTCFHVTSNGVYGGKVWSMKTTLHFVLVIHESVISACIHRRSGSGGSMGSISPLYQININTKPICNIQYSCRTFQIPLPLFAFSLTGVCGRSTLLQSHSKQQDKQKHGTGRGWHSHHEMQQLHRING